GRHRACATPPPQKRALTFLTRARAECRRPPRLHHPAAPEACVNFLNARSGRCWRPPRLHHPAAPQKRALTFLTRARAGKVGLCRHTRRCWKSGVLLVALLAAASCACELS